MMMTMHQSIADDRVLAQTIGHVCPIICGGHDHEIYHESITPNIHNSNDQNTTRHGDDGTSNSSHHHQYDTCQIVKAGMDAHNAAIIDIVWQRNAKDDDDDDDTNSKSSSNNNQNNDIFASPPTIDV